MLLKAPNNEKELKIFFKHLEVEMEHKKKMEIANKFKKFIKEFASEFGIDMETLRTLIGKDINSIKYEDIQEIVKALDDFLPGLAKLVKKKLKEWECQLSPNKLGGL